MKKVLITGGAGFIGSHVIRLFVRIYPQYQIHNLDKLTYAGNLNNLTDIDKEFNYFFHKGDICDKKYFEQLFDTHSFDGVIYLAAESHVDRSITNPLEFVMTNVIGTINLLNTAKDSWKNNNGKRFYHISTYEEYGSLGEEYFFLKTTSYDSQSPYSASKTSSDHLVRSYANTSGLPIVISNCSNNYVPNQFPEKLLPLCINNIKDKKPLLIYGKGKNIRDWLYVTDHARAIDIIFHKGVLEEAYNIGGFNEWKNTDIVELLCDIMDVKLRRSMGESKKLITYVKDRAGHDKRYAFDANKLNNELGWKPSLQFEQGLEQTVDWYLCNYTWHDHITFGDYLEYYENQYQL